MSDLIKQLESLSEDELEAVGRLIGKFAGRKKIPSGSAKRGNRKKKTRKRDEETVDAEQQELMIDHGPGRKQPRQRVVLDESEPAPSKRTAGRGRTQPRTQRNQRRANQPRRDRGGGSRGTMARTESVQISNENKFLRMRERNAEKKDTKIDAALWTDREPAERPEEFEFAEVQCKVCQLWFDVNPGLVIADPDTGAANFTCNNCSPRGR